MNVHLKPSSVNQFLQHLKTSSVSKLHLHKNLKTVSVIKLYLHQHLKTDIVIKLHHHTHENDACN